MRNLVEFLMFIASYQTYLKPNQPNTELTKKEPVAQLEYTKKFRQLGNNPLEHIHHSPQINYISDFKSFANKMKINQGELEYKKELDRSQQKQIKREAKTSYMQNSVMFSLLRKPGITLERVHMPSFPSLVQKGVETYIQNDNYYKRSA